MKKSNYISIKKYLDNKGIHPVKDREYYGMYLSPLRNDSNPSFKVDYDKDLWYDFGADEGGSIVDLVMKLENCSLAEAFRQLENSFSFHRNDTPAVSPKPTIREPALIIADIQPLTHPALLDYLKERSVNIDIAKQHCSEIHYSVVDKAYFAIGFRNDAGGYELRNKYFKGSTTPKNISTINNGSDTVMVFEGFMDFLSYLSMKQNPASRINSVILNSIANLPKAISFLQTHQTIHAFFDNDEARKAGVSMFTSGL
jgi:DNA primase